MKMKKYFVVADIHGFHDVLIKALYENGFEENNPNHILIICGDMIDRGSQSYQVLEYVYNLPKEQRIIIKGNHEELLEELIFRGKPEECDYKNGTYDTYLDIKEKLQFNSYEEFEETFVGKLFEELLDYYETKNYIFTHGYIPVIRENGKYSCYENWRKKDCDLWSSARWLDGIKLNIEGIREKNKVIVCGHKHSINGNIRKFYPGKAIAQLTDEEYFSPLLNQIYYDEGIICLDANTRGTKMINVLVLNEDEL